MAHSFTPEQLRNELARYLELGEQLPQRCESDIVSWRRGTDRMLSPFPYFEQVERGIRGATNWQVADRRWIDKPDEAKDPVRHGLDARGRLREFKQGSLHVLLDYPDWTDEIVYYARGNEVLIRYILADDRLLACYHARQTDCSEETFTWENGRVVKSVERVWIEEDGEFVESEFQEVLHYSVDAAGMLQEVRCQTLKHGLPSSEDVVFRRRRRG